MEFSIAHVSDFHVGSPEFMPEKIVTCIDEVNDLSPDLVALTGDLTMSGFEREYKKAKEYVDEFKAKTIVIPGNHDVRETGYTYYEEYFGEANQFVDLGPVTVIGVDSTLPDNDEGWLGRERIQWLNENLGKVKEKEFRVVLVHHHLIPFWNRHGEKRVNRRWGCFIQSDCKQSKPCTLRSQACALHLEIGEPDGGNLGNRLHWIRESQSTASLFYNKREGKIHENLPKGSRWQRNSSEKSSIQGGLNATRKQ